MSLESSGTVATGGAGQPGWGATMARTSPVVRGAVAAVAAAILVVVAGLPGAAVADAPGAWVQVVRAGGEQEDTGRAVAPLSDGSVIVAGGFSDTAAFPPAGNLVSDGQLDGFVGRVAADGTWTWRLAISGPNTILPTEVVVAPDGGILVAGTFAGSAEFPRTAPDPPVVLNAAGSNDVFVARVLPDGSAFSWALAGGSTALDRAAGLAVRTDGTALLAGTFQGTANFFPHAVVSGAGVRNVFLAAVGPGGTWDWVIQSAGALDAEAWGLAVNSLGAAVVTGSIEGPTTFAPENAPHSGGGGTDAFVAQALAGGGGWDWVNTVVSLGADRGTGVAVLPSNEVIVLGQFDGAATFGGAGVLNPVGNADAFAAQLTSFGVWQWAIQAGGVGVSTFVDGATALADGSVVGIGGFTGSVDFGATTLTSAGSNDIWVARVVQPGGVGAWDWAVSAGGPGVDQGYRVREARNRSLVVGAEFSATAAFGPHDVTSAGFADIVMAQLAQVPGRPSGVAGTPANGQVTVNWTAPTADGGSAVTGFTATADPGGQECTASTLMCTVTGLTNGTPYTFTVRATNLVGPGAASSPSGPVTPQAGPTPTPSPPPMAPPRDIAMPALFRSWAGGW